MQVLAMAIFVNTLGQCAFTFIQAVGRPDLTGKLHLAELPFDALLLWWLLPRWGIVGVAIAWAIRAIADAVVLLYTCPALLPESRPAVQRVTLWTCAILPLLGVSALVPSLALRLLVLVVVAPAWAVLAWCGS